MENELEFKGTEIFLTKSGLYEYSGVIHDDKKVFGVLINSNEKEMLFNFSEVLKVWRQVC